MQKEGIMKDDVLKGYIDSFIEDNDLAGMSDDKTFERFVNYCLISTLYPHAFDVEDICVGGGDDIGFDGVAIIINGNIISIMSRCGRLDFNDSSSIG